MKGTKWTALLCALVLTCGMTVDAAGFDAAYYAAHNPDVTAVVGEDAAALELHYHTFGAAEGRAANAAEAEQRAGLISFEEFDAEYYAAHNPDVTEITGTDKAALYAHYVLFGAAEGRMARAVVENPYARFASSASSGSHKSKSSKHSDASDSSNNTSSSGSGSSAATHTLHYTQNDGVTHTITCSVAGCTQSGHSGPESCSNFGYDYKAKSLGADAYRHIKTCRQCSYEQAEQCTPKDEYKQGTSDHSRICKFCDGVAEQSRHDYDSANGKCKDCQYECQHDFDGDSITCPTCGWECLHTAGWEDGRCMKCQYLHKNTSGSCTDDDNNGKCDTCGGDMHS